jgi:hypothetical protein
METRLQTETPPQTRPTAPPPRAGNFIGRTWSRAWAYTRANPMLAGFIVVGLIARIAFWAITDRKLDDALITIKFDKNLVDGFGLVHNLGEGHVQGFTSALSVLVPLPGELIYHGGGFLFIRLASLAFFVIAAVYAYRIAAELGVGRWPTAFVLAYLALDQNQVLFGVAGMETQIAVGVLLASVYYVLVEDYPKSGVTLGLSLLARPDFVLWVGPAYLFLVVRNWRASLRAGALSAAVLGPWLIFTTIYYGSPIPNTITAKNLAFGPTFPSLTHPGAWINFLGDYLSFNKHSWKLFAPFYEALATVHSPLPYGVAKGVAVLVAALAVIGAVSTIRRWSWLPAIAFLALSVVNKVIFLSIGYFEWYGPPAVAILILMAAVGLDRVCKWTAAATRGRLTPAAVALAPAILLAAVYVAALPYRMAVESKIQHDIEDKVRVKAGAYLGEVVKPGQTVVTESSGYLGYDTNGTWYDHPGLESPRVLEAIRKGEAEHVTAANSLAGIAHLLRPDWLVLRPCETNYFAATYPDLLPNYRRVRVFSTAGDLSGVGACGFSPGSAPEVSAGGFSVSNGDRTFIVYRRID